MSMVEAVNGMSTLAADRPRVWRDQCPSGAFDFLYTNQASPLPEEEIDQLVGQLHEAMPGYDVRQYFARQPTIFKDYAHLTVARSHATGTYAGLLGSRWYAGADLTYLYLWTAMISGAARKSGIVSALLFYQLAQIMEERGLPEVIATKTYNPVVVKVLQHVTSFFPSVSLYPRIGAPAQDPAMVDLARRVTAQLCPALTVRYEDAVVEGGQAAVGPDFFPEMPASGDLVVDAHFRKHLRREDQILVIMHFPQDGRDALASSLRKARAHGFSVTSTVRAMRDSERSGSDA